MKTILSGKTIVIGVCGGIAAYKCVELLRILKKQDVNVRVLMTKNAEQFVGKLTFESLSENSVCIDLFEERNDKAINHIKWAEEADAVIIAPATANMISKMANGLADDALSTFLLAVRSPVFVCPAMNTYMYENRRVQKNLDVLEADGCIIVEPNSGALACGVTGPGRLAEPEHIVDRLIKNFYPKDMVGKRVLITAGPTIAPIDPVRYISNHSSGKMGYAIARAVEYRGGEVLLISGPTALSVPNNVNAQFIHTVDEMAKIVFENMENMHIIIKVAAVADYRPVDCLDRKIKKDADEMSLLLKKNQDILAEIGRRKTHQWVIGFAAETNDLDKYAQLKLEKKNLDMIVGNLVGSEDSGFGVDTNKVRLYFRDGNIERMPLLSKEEVANRLVDRINLYCVEKRK